MALPITGPFYPDGINSTDLYSYKKSFKQVRPFNLPLAYTRYSCRATSRAVVGGGAGYPPSDPPPLTAGSAWSRASPCWQFNAAKVKAYDKLLASISDRSQWGENIGQARQTFGLIADGLTSLRKNLLLIKRNDPRGYRKLLANIGRTTASLQVLPSTILIWNFVIKTTMEDISNAVKILNEPVKAVDVEGTGMDFRESGYTSTAPADVNYWTQARLYCKYGMTVSVENPNLWLANNLGLINPVQIAWQLIPGSFLVDWFINVESWLGQATDFLGLNISSCYTTLYGKARGVHQLNPGWNHGRQDVFELVYLERTPTLITPDLRFRPLKIPGKTRATNAAALLSQVITKGKYLRQY